MIHENNGVLPLFAKIGKNSRFSYDPSSLPPNYFLSENNNTVSNIESTKTKYVNKKTRYVYTMPENFKPNVKHLYSRVTLANEFSKNNPIFSPSLVKYVLHLVFIKDLNRLFWTIPKPNSNNLCPTVTAWFLLNIILKREHMIHLLYHQIIFSPRTITRYQT
jgi:hypothetical protein